MKGLSPDELRNLSSWNDIKLLNAFEGYSDRKYLIDLQNASGIAHKDKSDPDVQVLHDTYDALRKEVLKRIPGVTNRNLVNSLEADLNAIAFYSAQGCLGIPSDKKSESKIQTIKSNFNTARKQIESKLRR